MLEDHQGAFEGGFMQRAQGVCYLLRQLARSHRGRILDHDDSAMAPQRKSQQVSKIAVTGDDNGLTLLRSFENSRIRRTAQLEFLDVVSVVASLSQKGGRKKGQVLVNEKSRHQASARMVSSSSLWAA